MRSLSYVGVLLLIGVVACASLGTAFAEEEAQMCVPLGAITLHAPDSVETKRAPVEFPHGKHLTLACNNCHHTFKGTEAIVGCKTSGCHDLAAMPKKPDSNAVDKAQAYKYYKSAFHGQCIGCHKNMKVQIQQMANTLAGIDGKLPTTGPTGCIECHPKE